MDTYKQTDTRGVFYNDDNLPGNFNFFLFLFGLYLVFKKFAKFVFQIFSFCDGPV